MLIEIIFAVFILGCSIALLKHDMLKKFYEQFNTDEQYLVDKPLLYVENQGKWIKTNISLDRPMDTVFIEDTIKTELGTIMNGFLDHKEWYESKYIPYKIGLLILGKLGDGKSSLISALACKYDLNIYEISLSNCRDPIAAISKIPTNQVNMIVFENIDFELNQLGERYSQIVPKLLSVMDGLMSIKNQVVVVTAMSLTGIPDEFKRIGRFNHIIHLKPPTTDVLSKYFKWFYADTIADTSDLAKNFATSIHHSVPMSAIQNYLIKYRDNPNDAVKNAMSIGL